MRIVIYKAGNRPRMLELGVKLLLGYFVGSFLGSMVVGRLRGGVDIRTMGSGNAGGTNALRTQGLGFALGVVVIDVGKGAIAAGVIPAIQLPVLGDDPAISRDWLQYACGAAAVVGHVWPMWHRFRGGKGAATLIGTLIVLAPALILPVLIVWAWVLTLFGYVGLATMIAGVTAPVWVGVTRLPDGQPLFVYCVALALFVLFTHRSNIHRMLAGTEPRNRSLMLFGRSQRPSMDDD
ncbi:MAG TPA: glycerol-3-phosphate 1-O-acyltransferase PlsY [Woeseiaceae bacterium]|nr:glycerol-3-phosphate 1-O-acyltransferase PlsY [Woeseiaceae bacterium]